MLGRIKNAKPEEEITVTAGTEVKEVLPSSGKTIKKVTVNPTPSQAKSATPSASKKTVTPDSGKLLNKVTIAGDSDLVAGNIKKDVNIFGVTGTFDGEEIVNGIIEEYYTYYNDISPNTFVEYIGELSYPYSSRQQTQIQPYSDSTFVSPIAVQLNDNTVVIATINYSGSYSRYLVCVALSFDMNNNSISVGSMLQVSLDYNISFQTDKTHLVRMNDTTFGVVTSVTKQVFREYSQYIYFTSFSVSSNTITLLRKEQQVYESTTSNFTSTIVGVSAMSITDNFLLIITPTSYESSYKGSLSYRIMVCALTNDSSLNIIANYNFNVVDTSNSTVSYSEINSSGFSLCKISQNKYIWVIRSVTSVNETYYFWSITLSSDYKTISIKYITENVYQNNNPVILYLSKNLSTNGYCYALVSKSNTTYQQQGFPVFFTIKYNENDDTLLFSTIVSPSVNWTDASVFTWVMCKSNYGLFGQNYRAGSPSSTSIYGHVINDDGTLNFIIVAQSIELHSVAEILPPIFNTPLNKILTLQWGSNKAWLYNIYLEPFSVQKRIKESTNEIFGLTKTKCRTHEEGKVWLLNKTTELTI